MVRISGFLLLLSLNTFGQVNLNKGLVAYYPFNGSLNDESGRQNHPVSSKVTFTKGKDGTPKTACYFNGSNNFIRIRSNKDLTPQQMTLVAIVKPMGFYMGKCYNNSIIDKGTSDYLPGVYALRFTAGEYTRGDCDDPALAYQNFVGSSNVNPGITSKDIRVKTGTWYCIIYTVSDSEEKLYVNGILISKTKKIADIGYNNDDLFLGRKNNAQYPYWFNGVMDEIRIYNRVLNTEEVKLLCTQNIPEKKTDLACEGANKVTASFKYYINDCNKAVFDLASAKNTNLYKVQWFFGDGMTSTEKEPSHRYNSFETFTARVIVTSKTGCRDTMSRKIQIQSLETGFTYTEENEPGRLYFKARNNSAGYDWDFGDGKTGKGYSAISHTYTESGQYTASLFARNSAGCTDTSTTTINVLLPDAKDSFQTDGLITATLQPAASPILEKRQKDIVKNLVIESDSLTVSLYDNGIIDGDSITLIFNDEVLLTHHLLKNTPVTIKLHIDKARTTNELIMYAENLGSIPPNTAFMIIQEGTNRHYLSVSSSKSQNGVITFTFR